MLSGRTKSKFVSYLTIAFFLALPAHAGKPECGHEKIAGKAPKAPKEAVIPKITLPLRGGPVDEVELLILGRGPAEKRFKAEEKRYAEAKDDERRHHTEPG